jgi:hypothetical protein
MAPSAAGDWDRVQALVLSGRFWKNHVFSGHNYICGFSKQQPGQARPRVLCRALTTPSMRMLDIAIWSRKAWRWGVLKLIISAGQDIETRLRFLSYIPGNHVRFCISMPASG